MSETPSLQWLLENVRSVGVKYLLLPQCVEAECVLLEVFAVDDGVEELVLRSMPLCGNSCPSWTLSGLQATPALRKHLSAQQLALQVRCGGGSECSGAVACREELDLRRLVQLLPQGTSGAWVYPPNFLSLCVSDELLLASERALAQLQRVNAAIVNRPALFALRALDVAAPG
eukprot:gene43583-53291_t